MRAALFDVDGTLTDVRVWQGLMDYFKTHGLKKWTMRWFWIVHSPLYFLYKWGLIQQSAFRRPWAANLSWLFRGYTVEAAETIWDWVVTEHLAEHWRTDILAVLRQHKAAGDLVVLVSAGPEPLQARIAREVGADFAIGTRHGVRAGKYTGRYLPPVCMDEYKAIMTRARLAALGQAVDFAASYAYADSLGDVALLEMVGNPRAVYPDSELLPVAEARGWKILS